ncbi:MAG TPA: cache domain-containing protein [Thermodesulfovibrionales bacterium]|nr:cache domain-containing protein [Thermodesulfovibrionales bacterium]
MHRKEYKREILKVAMPPILTMLLFAAAVFGVALPLVERDLVEQKKKMITAATQTAVNILAFYEGRISSGEISIDEARNLAIRQIRAIRYGNEGKDYFWINDLGPNMVMHPYRPDLEGKDISDFQDPKGTHLFKEFVAVVLQSGSGFVPYLWQWQDDPNRIVPKLSYVQLFKPWGWIIGTGIYVNDVHEEISDILRKLIYSFILILAVVAVLAFVMIRKGITEMHMRWAAEDEVARHRGSLEELVEERTAELRQALSEVKTLSGFLPICASCKKIRDDKGYWNQIEAYISERSAAEFSHGICPECAKLLYSDLADKG